MSLGRGAAQENISTYCGAKGSSRSSSPTMSGFYLFVKHGQTQLVCEPPELWDGGCCHRQHEQVRCGLEGLCPGKVIDSPACPGPDMMGQIWKQQHPLRVYRGLENKHATCRAILQGYAPNDGQHHSGFRPTRCPAAG